MKIRLSISLANGEYVGDDYAYGNTKRAAETAAAALARHYTLDGYIVEIKGVSAR